MRTDPATTFLFACSLLIAGCAASVKPLPAEAAPPVADAAVGAGGSMSCKSCKASGDSIRAVRAAVREALGAGEKEGLRAALVRADGLLAGMEAMKAKCKAGMMEAGKPDSAAAPEAGGHEQHH